MIVPARGPPDLLFSLAANLLVLDSFFFLSFRCNQGYELATQSGPGERPTTLLGIHFSLRPVSSSPRLGLLFTMLDPFVTIVRYHDRLL